MDFRLKEVSKFSIALGISDRGGVVTRSVPQIWVSPGSEQQIDDLASIEKRRHHERRLPHTISIVCIGAGCEQGASNS